jgi:hypothetical protein
MLSEKDHRKLEAILITSWNKVEAYYTDQAARYSAPCFMDVIGFIKVLRKRGYDRQLWVDIQKEEVERGILIHSLRFSRYLCYISTAQLRLTFSFTQYSVLNAQLREQNIGALFELHNLTITPHIEELFSLLLAYPMEYRNILDGSTIL